MHQNMGLFSQPMTFGSPPFVRWNSSEVIPFGVETNWSHLVCCGDSSAPEMFLINSQLVLASHNFHQEDGPNYAFQFDAINQQMHYLSTNYNVGTDYQLTPFLLTNWPAIH